MQITCLLGKTRQTDNTDMDKLIRNPPTVNRVHYWASWTKLRTIEFIASRTMEFLLLLLLDVPRNDLACTVILKIFCKFIYTLMLCVIIM